MCWRADCVLSDNTSGSYMLTEHLIATGRKSIGFVGSVQSTSSIMDRYLGYVKAMLRAGLPIRDDWRLEDRDDRGPTRCRRPSSATATRWPTIWWRP